MSQNKIDINRDHDLVCVGAGIMNATLALYGEIAFPEIVNSEEGKRKL